MILSTIAPCADNEIGDNGAWSFCTILGLELSSLWYVSQLKRRHGPIFTDTSQAQVTRPTHPALLDVHIAHQAWAPAVVSLAWKLGNWYDACGDLKGSTDDRVSI